MVRAVVVTTGLLMVPMAGCKYDGEDAVAVVGVDENGREIAHTVSGKQYGKRLGKALTKVNKEVMSAVPKDVGSRQWKLSRIDVGVALSASFGFSFASLGAEPALRITFKKK